MKKIICIIIAVVIAITATAVAIVAVRKNHQLKDKSPHDSFMVSASSEDGFEDYRNPVVIQKALKEAHYKVGQKVTNEMLELDGVIVGIVDDHVSSANGRVLYNIENCDGKIHCVAESWLDDETSVVH